MQVDILTLFPEMFQGPFEESIIKRAQEKGFAKVKVHNLRDWTKDRHKTVDDSPYGGGAGMIIRVDIVDAALADLKKKNSKVILLDATGKTFDQRKAKSLAKEKHLILIAGHYEGVDHRVHKHLADEVISIGDYVLTGGEIPAMVITDAVVRLVPGVIEPESLKEESHTPKGYLEYSQYTRPENYKGWKVPKILLSGHHAKIKKWRERKS